VQLLRVAEKNLANRGWIAGENEGRDAGNADREPIAEASRAIVHELEWIAHEVEGLDDAGTRRQARGGRVIPLHG